MTKKEFKKLLLQVMDYQDNPFHPFVFINGKPKIGKNVSIGVLSEVNAKGAKVVIGDNCDIASFVSINVADSHKQCLGRTKKIERAPITLEDNVFVGSHCFIGGGTHIGHHSVVGAGTIVLKAGYIPPYSLVIGNPAQIKKEYFLKKT